MWPRKNMQGTIDGVRYQVNNSLLLAHNWDSLTAGSVRSTTFLYCTPDGRYFAVHITREEGKPDQIEALTIEEARYFYNILRKKEVPEEEAFKNV